MKLVRNVTIGVRLGWGFTIVLLCALAIGAVGIWQLHTLQRSVAVIVEEGMDSMAATMEMREIGGALSLAMRRVSAPTDAAEGEREVQRIGQLLRAYDDAEQRLVRGTHDGPLQAMLERVRAEKSRVLPVMLKVVSDAKAANYFDAASAVSTQFLPVHEQWARALTELAALERRHAARTYEDLQAQQAGARQALLAAGALTVLLGVGCALAITRSITTPLAAACAAADAIAARDLRQHIDVAGRDEAGRLAAALRSMQLNLVEATVGIRTGAEVLADVSREIAQGNDDLSARTQSQAAALEGTALAMTELTGTVRMNAERAREAHGLAGRASGAVEQGGAVVEKVVATMDAIRASSDRIADIIAVIDGIAFQTNILALNAAVEAARAGDHGRGFATVASEVRALAQRAAGAAREIKTLIGESVGNVGHGVQLADAAVRSMQGTVASVRQVADIIEQIAAASEEQHAGIARINRAIGDIDAMTQQNAALVEQSAAAAASMSQQTAALVATVRVFKTGAAPRQEGNATACLTLTHATANTARRG